MKTEDVQKHFQAQVPAYPELMQRLVPYYDLQRDLMMSLLPRDRRKPLRILDLGCGPGIMAERLLAEFPSAQLFLFDLTAEMITACRERLGDNPRVSYQVGDFQADEFGTGYDVVIASLSLHHGAVAERPVLAARLFNSLAPGGRLVTAEVVVDEAPDVREQQYELWRRFMASQGEDSVAWYEKHLAKDHPVQIRTWINALSDAGFRPVGCFWRYLNFAIFGGWRPAV